MYIVLYVLLFVMFFISKLFTNKNKAKKTYIIVITLVLSLLSGLRNLAVGNDTYAYYISFNDFKYKSLSIVFNDFYSYFTGENVLDPGYYLITYLCYNIIPDFALFQLFIALLLFSAIGRIIYKSVDSILGYTISYSFYISLYYAFFPNSASRQSMALAFFLWAIIYMIEKRKTVLPIILAIFAFTMHKSILAAVIPIILYRFVNLKLVYKMALFIMPILFILGKILTTYLIIFAGAERYMMYVESEGGSSVAFILQIAIYYFIGYFSLKKLNDNVEGYLRYAYISFAITFMIVSFIRIDPSLQRLIAYFSIWGVVFIPKAVSLYSGAMKKALVICVLSLAIGRSVMIPEPYKFNWEKMELHDRYKYF